MGHVALYRQFRPITFDEIVEQKHAVAALRQSVISGQVGHAYLFCGTRGTGKTTIAKIFSRAINCLSPRDGNPCNECEICRGILDNTLMDVIEMDAASNNSVDNIRRVCDEVMFMPSRAKYKVYIIDEVHMLSGGAFNALLKTLEEPPAHAVFILATTEPHRIPATIISRCQRYDFRRIPTESMVQRLQDIADAQNTVIDHDALVTISNLSDGALRDGISLLDQVSTGVSRRITRDDVLRITGVVDDAFLYAMADAILAGDSPSIITLTEQLVMDGRDMIRFTLDLAHYFRDLMVIRVTPDPENLVQATSDSMGQMQELAGRTASETLVYAVTRLSGLVSELKWSPDMRTSFEIALLSFGAGDPGFVRKSASQPATARPAPRPSQSPVPAPAAVSSSVSAPAAPESVVRPAVSAPFAEPPAVSPPVIESRPVAAPVVESLAATPVVESLAAAPVLPSPHAQVKPLVSDEPLPWASPAAADAKKPESTAPKSRGYMPPPPIEAIFMSSSPMPGQLRLTPQEATLQPPPEEDYGLPPPPFEEPLNDTIPYEALNDASSQVNTATPATEEQPSQAVDLQPELPPNVEPELPVTAEATLPFPDEPGIPASEEQVQAVTAQPQDLNRSRRGLPLTELWATLLHNWEDTIFADALQLRQAAIYEEDQVFYIVFPDHMQAYANSLTQRADYKKISKDICTVISGITSVEVQTQSQKDGRTDKTESKESSAGIPSAQPDWVAQMLAFSEATGIPVETLENL